MSSSGAWTPRGRSARGRPPPWVAMAQGECVRSPTPLLLAPCVFTCVHMLCTFDRHVFTFRPPQFVLVGGRWGWSVGAFSTGGRGPRPLISFGRIVSSICCRSDSSSVCFRVCGLQPIPLAWSAALLSRSTAPVSTISPSPLSDSQTPLDRRSLRSDDHRPSSWNAQSRSASP